MYHTPDKRGAYISIHVLRVEDDLLRQLYHILDSNFNPRPPCGGRLRHITAYLNCSRFQSTSSVWRTTIVATVATTVLTISIHVLRVEDDIGDRHLRADQGNFNPRPPCGGRQSPIKSDKTPSAFQSTSSVWRTTTADIAAHHSIFISIHVLRVEDDSKNREKSLFAFI